MCAGLRAAGRGREGRTRDGTGPNRFCILTNNAGSKRDKYEEYMLFSKLRWVTLEPREPCDALICVRRWSQWGQIGGSVVSDRTGLGNLGLT